MRPRKSFIGIFSVLFPLCMAIGLAGCGKFFVPENGGGGGGGGGTGTGNYFYVANQATGSVADFRSHEDKLRGGRNARNKGIIPSLPNATDC